MRDADLLAVCHPEFLEDLQYWVKTDWRVAKRLLELVQGRYHYGWGSGLPTQIPQQHSLASPSLHFAFGPARCIAWASH